MFMLFRSQIITMPSLFVQTVHNQFPEGYEIEKRLVKFDTTTGSEPAISIDFENSPKGGWVAGLSSGKPRVSMNSFCTATSTCVHNFYTFQLLTDMPFRD